MLSVVERNDADIVKLRKFGEQSGMEFQDPAPAKDGSHVPREGRSMPDKLKYSDLNGLFPPPDVSSFVLLNNLTADVVNIIVKFLMSYRDSFLKQFTELFDLYAASLNNNEDMLVFYLVDLYSHCDSKFRNIMKNKALSLFNPDVRAELLEVSSEKNGKSSGLFVGQLQLICYQFA